MAGHASVRGISHVKSGAPCQDAGRCWISPDDRFAVGAVADGGGSLDRSDVGSELAASLVVSATAARIVSGELVDASEQELERHWRTVVRDVRAVIAQEAKVTPHAAARDYGTTLIAFAILGRRFAAMQIGDGFLVVGADANGPEPRYRLVFKPTPVEQVGEVVWLTSSLWEEDFRCTVTEMNADFVAASTDGLEKVAIQRREQLPFPGFFTPLAQRVGEAGSAEDLCNLAMTIVSMKSLDNKVDDDKTLLLARRFP